MIRRRPTTNGTSASTRARLSSGAAIAAAALGLSVLIPASGAHAAGDDPISVPDPNFRACIIDTLGFAAGDEITEDDAASITNMNCNVDGVADITGAEFLTSVTQLTFFQNEISDVTPLQHLTTLEDLDLSRNNLTDITPLQGLVNLEILRLGVNDITDISPLSGLGELWHLSLQSNNISDVTPLAGLDSMRLMSLDENRITDLSPLGGHLPNLQTGSPLTVENQSIDLGEHQIGVPVPLPTVVAPDGTTVALDADPRDNGDGTFTPTGAPGAASPLAWSGMVPILPTGRNIPFSGEFTFTQATVPVTIDGPADGTIFVEGSATPAPDRVSGTAAPSSDVEVTIYAGGALFQGPTIVTANTGGAWELTFSPALTPGSYTVQARQPDTLSEVTFEVRAAAVNEENDEADAGQDPETLANTGADAGVGFAAGGVLAVAGAAILLVRRRLLDAV